MILERDQHDESSIEENTINFETTSEHWHGNEQLVFTYLIYLCQRAVCSLTSYEPSVFISCIVFSLSQEMRTLDRPQYDIVVHFMKVNISNSSVQVNQSSCLTPEILCSLTPKRKKKLTESLIVQFLQLHTICMSVVILFICLTFELNVVLISTKFHRQ